MKVISIFVPPEDVDTCMIHPVSTTHVLLPLFCRKYQQIWENSYGTIPMLLLFLWIVTAKSPCDFTVSMCFGGRIVETNRIFEYKPFPTLDSK